VIAEKPAQTKVPIHPLLAGRWSGRAFDARDVSHDEMHALLEAARWAPSSANEQPWRLIVVRRAMSTHAAVIASLSGANPRWAALAPVIVVVAASTTMEKSGKPNRYAWHDAGLATAMLCVQAASFGLATHVLAGWNADALRAAVAIPVGFDPVNVIVVGHPGDADSLPEDLRVRELTPRTRRPLDEIAFAEKFGEPCMHEVSPAAAHPTGREEA